MGWYNIGSDCALVCFLRGDFLVCFPALGLCFVDDLSVVGCLG